MQNMFSNCTGKLNYTAPNPIIRAVTQPLPLLILNLKPRNANKIT